MIRGKKKNESKITKFKRRDKTMEYNDTYDTEIIITKPWGGFLPHPPKNCTKKEFFRKYDSIVWLDLSVCHNCNIKKECSRRKEYLKSLKNKEKVI